MPRFVAVAFWSALWCLGHSLFITHRWRDATRRLFPRYHAFSRLIYVILNTATFGLLFIWLHTLPERVIWAWPGWWAVVRWVGLGEALLLFWLGSRAYDNRAFLGLTQARDFLAGRAHADPPFRAEGILAVIRHPWYSGTLLFLVFCLPFTDVNLAWRGVFLIYTLIGTELEERKLLRELGDLYADYRRRVPRFFPWPWSRGGDPSP